MFEPIVLKNVASMKAENLRTAMSNYNNGEALVVSFASPSAYFFGRIPRQVTVAWSYNNKEEVYFQKYGRTFFFWNHTVKYLIITGLVSHVYQVGEIPVNVTFHIFDPKKFLERTNADELNTKIENFVVEMFKDKQNVGFHSPEFYRYMSDKFMEANRIFQPLGVGITAIDPPGYN